MTLPTSGPIGMEEVRLAYLAPKKTPLTALVSGGIFVPGAVTNFPGENIPSAPPISLDDFYGAGLQNDQIAEQNFVMTSAIAGGTIHVLNSRAGGLFVPANLGGSSVTDEASFIMDVQLKLNANNDEVFFSSAINGTTNVFFGSRNFGIGLTTANPLFSSNAAMANRFIGWHSSYFRSDLDTHYLRRFWGHVDNQSSTFNETGAGYADDVLPTKTLYSTLRIERGAPGGANGFARWRLTYYRDRTAWTTTWDTTNSSTTNTGGLDPNSGGYLCLYNTDGFGSNYDLDIQIVKAVVGTKVVPW